MKHFDPTRRPSLDALSDGFSSCGCRGFEEGNLDPKLLDEENTDYGSSYWKKWYVHEIGWRNLLENEDDICVNCLLYLFEDILSLERVMEP